MLALSSLEQAGAAKLFKAHPPTALLLFAAVPFCLVGGKLCSVLTQSNALVRFVSLFSFPVVCRGGELLC